MQLSAWKCFGSSVFYSLTFPIKEFKNKICEFCLKKLQFLNSRIQNQLCFMLKSFNRKIYNTAKNQYNICSVHKKCSVWFRDNEIRDFFK